MNPKKPSLSHKGGFSLLETLVVILLVGILASLVVNVIPDYTIVAKNAKSKRNAQNLASVFAAADSAGLNFAGADIAETISKIVTGANVVDPGSPYDGAFFGLPEMSDEEQAAAANFLTLDTGLSVLVYNANAGYAN